MSLSVHWFLPSAGDSRDVVAFGPTDARRPPDLDHLAQVARTAESLRLDAFDELILSGQPHLEEAWGFGEGVIPRLRAADLLADPVLLGDTPTWSRLRPSPN